MTDSKGEKDIKIIVVTVRSNEEETIYELEDVNKDGVITIGDLALVSKNYNKNNQDKNWEQIKIYDVNKDGVINNLDIEKVMEKILN